MRYTEFENMKDKEKYQVLIICSECRSKITESKQMTGKEIKDSWTMIVMGSPLNTGRCPKCKYSTFSDCNMHTDLKIKRVISKEL